VFTKIIELNETGRDQPVFSFTGKRHQHSQLPWLTACTLWKSSFCF